MEGLLTSVMIRTEDAGAIKRGMFHFFMTIAKRVEPDLMNGRSVGTLDRLLYALGRLMVYGPLLNNLGFSRVRVAYTVGEAIGPDLFTFYRPIGVNLKQLYDSTETAVFVCLQPDNQARADSVGVPIRGVQIKVRSIICTSTWMRMASKTWPPMPTAASFLSTPGCASKRPTAQGWSDKLRYCSRPATTAYWHRIRPCERQ